MLSPPVSPIAERLISSKAEAQSVLIYGPDLGRQSLLANSIAQAWLCLGPTPQGGCGHCAACRSFLSGMCVDFQRIEPQPPSNLILNGAITPDSKRDTIPTVPLTEYFRTRPMVGRFKVVVIEQAERMNTEAASALLKILEEPHAYCRMILTTTSFGALLPTIRSRCLPIPCRLEEPSERTDEVVAAFSEGLPSLEPKIAAAYEAYEKLLHFCRGLPQALPGAAIKLAEEFRAIADEIQAVTNDSSRNADVEALRALGAWMMDVGWSEAAIHVAEAHRRVLGNGQFGLVTDALFARICASG